MNRNQPQGTTSMMEHEPAALAAELFDHFSSASTMRQILGLYRSMCDTIGLRPGPINEFYPKLKSKIRSWKAQALWKKFDARASHKVYNKGLACNGTRVLVIGAGPCGLRTAIEAQLLGAKVVLVEKRDRFSRNNVLHLWPFLITDLRNLGAKKFYGKFCAGSIDHISIRQLQCILLKVALLLGVEVHEGISFIKTIQPKDGCGWRAEISPEDHAVSHYEFNVLIGADGKRNTLEGFRRKEFRGRLAIAITANFINKKTWAEAKVEEISGVAFIFNQAFFKELYQTTGIDLENIVYYKDETHYFVMTAKKHSLIDKGVIMQDFSDPAELLAQANVNTERLLDYAKEAAEFSTKYQMANLEFAVNHYGKPDVAMFDFTSMFAAEISCSVTVRKNYRLLQCLVGDSLLEPFWPTGSGCARGFLSSMDAAYAVKLWSNQRNSILAVLAQRESIYRLLAQTTPENLHRDIGAYTLDPATRYPNLNRTAVSPQQVRHLLDSDDPTLFEQTFVDSNALQTAPETLIRRKRRTADVVPLNAVLLRWIKAQLSSYEFITNIQNASECFTNGQVFCCLINRYRPDLIDLTTLKGLNVEACNERAFSVIEREIGIPRAVSAVDSVTLENVDSKIWLNYLEQVCEVFRGEIPHVKHPKLDLDKLREAKTSVAPDFSRLLKFTSARKFKSPSKDSDRSRVDDERPRRSRKFDTAVLNMPSATPDVPTRRARKRRSHEKFGNIEERAKCLQEIESNRAERQNKRRLHRAQQTENFFKSLHMLQANKFFRENDSSSPFEDYSIYMYRQSAPEFKDRVKDLEQKLLYPDRERGILTAQQKNSSDEQFNDRIKSMEQRIAAKNQTSTDKKPKDLLRAIGKIESNDWNIRQIEQKIEQSKKTEVGKSREKVPKWSKEQFLQRQNKITQQEDQEITEERFKEIDQTIKQLDKQLKEGSIRELGERGKNKVASIAGNFVKKDENNSEEKLQKSNSKVGLVFNQQKASDYCHFCKQKVYLMEKLSAEGLVLHRGCLKCHHCHTSLRVGGYAFDRDDPEGKFYCTQHYRLPAKVMRPVSKKSTPNKYEPSEETVKGNSAYKTPEKTGIRADSIKQLDLLDRGQTPERIEFENVDAMSDGEPSIEHIIDENEWTDRNFGTASEESGSDISSSDESDSETDSDIYEDVVGSPLEAQTLQLANDWIGKQRYPSNQYSDDDEFYASSEDDEADSQTEGEEFEKARAIRMQEVKLKPIPYLPTDTETEIQSDTDSSSAIGLNSATEISTDSEFERDPVAPQIPSEETRKAARIQVKQGVIENSVHRTALAEKPHSRQKKYIHLEFEPLVKVDPSVMSTNREPLQNPRVGNYLLKQTASTEGIASKKSLELKKRYLLGDSALSAGIMKSDSMSMLDSKFKNFHSSISGCQKLLNPSPDNGTAIETSAKDTTAIENTNKSTVVNQSKALGLADLEEKENVYEQIVSTRNEINKSDALPETSKSAFSADHSESKQSVLVENIIRDSSSKLIETIDLDSPKKIALTTNSSDNSHREIFERKFEDKRISSIESVEKLHCDDIGLTIHQPVIDRSLECKFEDYTPVYENKTETEINYFTVDPKKDVTPQDKAKSLVDTMLKKSQDLDKDSMQTMPCIVWASSNQKRQDSDTFSSSTTSSPADIPHFILDSTTSPETQATPLEPYDKSKDLMQMDSLMLIDGKYIGDPDDLKHIQMPELVNSAVNKTIIHVQQCETVSNPIANKSTKMPEVLKYEEKTFRYEPIYKRPIFKFDTKNENKVDTLKNLPFIVPNESEKPSKPILLSLIKNTTNPDELSDNDKTPTVANPGNILLEVNRSDSETEITGQALTETELSDWTADDAVSENFVDIEFTINSNKGTIKRNKKTRKKPDVSSNGQKNRCFSPDRQNTYKQAPIAKNLDFDEIEFMDTGSEDSCIETYAATNKAMLNNRGYVQFVNNNSDGPINHFNYKDAPIKPTRIDLSEISSRPKEVRGVDFIEQGAFLLANEIDLKTPMNEPQPVLTAKIHSEPQQDSHFDIEEDSLVMIASNEGNTTTEESDALTVVTSPLEPAPRYDESSSINANSIKSHSIISNALSGKKTFNCKYEKASALLPESSEKQKPTHSNDDANPNRKNSDDITYEDYVRQLQLKITQISNARDSIDIRKTKRKNSKSEISGEEQVLQSQQLQRQQSPSSVIDNNKSLSIYVSKTNEPTTVIEKLEEISKERTKQKDLIHDLVMDKLQSKKQSNAEKRLNRSRNRSVALSISPSTTILPPTSTKMPAIVHSQSVAAISPSPKFSYQASEHEHRHCMPNPSTILSLSPTREQQYVAQSNKGVQRPHSANVENYPIFATPKLCKTQSFCIHSNRDSLSNQSHKNVNSVQHQFSDNMNAFSTPVISRRRNPDVELTQTTEKLRQDARIRARLKSNQDLGLSPEEKIALLRKRYNLDNSIPSSSLGQNSVHTVITPNKSDDMKVRERKMISSKSVNDIATNASLLSERDPAGKSTHRILTDFTSNPNLVEEKISPKRRPKDPERRKSIIQAVSDFFHKKRDKESSSPKEKSEGMFGRLRISPKSKSKDKVVVSNERSKSENCLETAKQKRSDYTEDLSEDLTPPPVPPLPVNYQRSDDESYLSNDNREQKKLRALTKATRQAELKRLRIAQEIQREQEEIEVKLKDLEARGVMIEKELRGEEQLPDIFDPNESVGMKDDKLLKELMEIHCSITRLKKRDGELSIRQKELQLEYRHAQLKEQLNVRLSCGRLDKTSSDVAAEGAILNEMLDIVAKRAALRSNDSQYEINATPESDPRRSH